MERRLTAFLAVAVALGLPLGSADAKTTPSRGTFALAQDLAPSRGGPAGAPRGYLPLHLSEFTAAKARANANAKGGGKPGGGGGGGSGATVSSYSNVSPSFNGISQTGGTPPDTTGAAGPDRYIETINTSYAIYSKSGSSINSGSLSALTGITGGIFGYSLSDPQMMWDAGTGRFYYTAVFYDAFLSNIGLAIGWSKTATPASSNDFCKYTIGFGSDLPDYPKLGDSRDFVMVGYNLFSDAASTYAGSEFTTVNKPAPGTTCAPTSQFAVHFSPTLHNGNGSLASTPVPANRVDDTSDAGYVVANADLTTVASANFASIWSVTTGPNDANGIPTPVVSGPVTASVASYSMPANAHQLGSSYLLDTIDGRFEAAVVATDPGHAGAQALWTAHAVFGGAGAEERWYEFNPATGAVLQNGTVGSSSLYVWNGAISPDRAGSSFGDSMAISVSTSSSTTYPAIQFAWKKGAGAQSALTKLVQANTPNVDFSCSSTAACRWGDYSGASPDPAATGTVGKVWLANQYNLAGNTSSTAWRTWVFGVTPTG